MFSVRRVFGFLGAVLLAVLASSPLHAAAPAGADSVEERLAALESQVATLRQALNLTSLDVPGVAAKALPAVVSVYNVTARDEIASRGTGWLLTGDGVIVTNAHVLDGQYTQKVKFADGTALPAKVVLNDPFSDLAELQVPGVGYPTLPLAREAPRLGEPVVVIGNALGFSNSVSVGVISGTNRFDPSHQHHYPALQIDAAVNHGNSGGPILNGRGEVVGIAAWRAEDGADGLGFAIPVTQLLDTLARVVPNRGVVRPWLGASVKEPYWSRGDGLPNYLGVVVTDVHPDGAGFAGGLRRNDYITAVDDAPVNDFTQLRGLLEKHRPGEQVVLSVARQQQADGKWVDQKLTVTLGENSAAVPGLVPKLYDPQTDDLF